MKSYILCLLLFVTITNSVAKDNVSSLSHHSTEKGYYVIVGAFQLYSNAVNYTKKLNNSGFNANHAKLTDKDFNYVYLFFSHDYKQAYDERLKLIQNPSFKDAWILYTKKIEPAQTAKAKTSTQNNSGKHINHNSSSNKTEQSAQNVKPEQTPIKSTQTEYTPAKESLLEENSTESEQTIIPIKNAKSGNSPANQNYKIYLNTINVQPYREVEGKIKIIDAQNAKFIKEAPSHKLDTLTLSPTQTSILLTSDIFGYRKLSHDIDLSKPITDETKTFASQTNDTLIITFELARYTKGDIVVLYNIFFYNDATIMHPRSRYELNQLYEMLVENPKIKIKIHGHTNGNSRGKIISMKKDDTNFFNLSHDNKIGSGSAKELSLQRANTIKNYLVNQGIEESRMQTFGWGGKKMIYDKDHPEAKKNVRVEIEIVEN
jgi:outer membrane protein OmpA-like peptidoglycan-associated protein